MEGERLIMACKAIGRHDAAKILIDLLLTDLKTRLYEKEPSKYMELIEYKASDSLVCSFSWRATTQKHEYWETLNKQLMDSGYSWWENGQVF